MSNKNGSLNSDNNCATLPDELARTVLDSMSAHIAILDKNGVILDVNRAWRKFATRSGMPEGYDSRGENYLEICYLSQGQDASDAKAVAEGILAVISEELDEFLYDYPCHSPRAQHWYYLRVIRVAGERPERVVVSHEEITALKLTEEALRKSREELEQQKRNLEEANIALKVLLKQRENDRSDLENKVLGNVKDLVFPYIEKLRNSPLKKREMALVEIVNDQLEDIVSPFLRQMSNVRMLLTPQEMQVATLVKDGKTSKEIADILNVTEATINFHRKNLRQKFGLKGKSTGSRTYLLSLA